MADADIGLIGLGTMGAMLSLNIADNGFRVAVFNRTTARTTEFISNAGPLGWLADRLSMGHVSSVTRSLRRVRETKGWIGEVERLERMLEI